MSVPQFQFRQLNKLNFVTITIHNIKYKGLEILLRLHRRLKCQLGIHPLRLRVSLQATYFTAPLLTIKGTT